MKIIFSLIKLLFSFFVFWCQCYGFAFVVSHFVDFKMLSMANIFFLVYLIVCVCYGIYKAATEKKD